MGVSEVNTSTNNSFNFITDLLNFSWAVCCSNLSANSSLPKALNSLAVLPWISCWNKISANWSDCIPTAAAMASCWITFISVNWV